MRITEKTVFFFLIFQLFFRNLRYTCKKEFSLQDSPPAADHFSDIISLRRSAILPRGLFHFIGKFNEVSYKAKNSPVGEFFVPVVFFLLYFYFHLADNFPQLQNHGWSDRKLIDSHAHELLSQ